MEAVAAAEDGLFRARGEMFNDAQRSRYLERIFVKSNGETCDSDGRLSPRVWLDCTRWDGFCFGYADTSSRRCVA